MRQDSLEIKTIWQAGTLNRLWGKRESAHLPYPATFIPLTNKLIFPYTDIIKDSPSKPVLYLEAVSSVTYLLSC